MDPVHVYRDNVAMRIIYITAADLDFPDGQAIHTRSVCKALNMSGTDIRLLGPRFSSRQLADPCASQRIPDIPIGWTGPARFMLYDRFAGRALTSWPFAPGDVAWFRRGPWSRNICRVLETKKIPHVVEINGLISDLARNRPRYAKLIPWLLRREKADLKSADRIVCVTGKLADVISSIHNIHPDKIRVISNGVDTTMFNPRVHADEQVKSSMPGFYQVVGFSGNMARWQGLSVLAHAFAQIRQTHPSTRLVAAGSGAMFNMLRREPGVLAMGPVPYERMPSIVRTFDVGVSLFEAEDHCPLKIFEYMACGIPVVVSRYRETAFIHKEGAGILVSPGNIKETSLAIRRLLDNRDLRMQMGARGAELARKKYSWMQRVEDIRSLALAILSKKRKNR